MYARRAARFKPLSAPPPGELPPLEPREVRRFIDPDATGAIDGLSWETAYRSLNAWNAAEATNLVNPDNWHHVYARSSAGTADTLQCTVNNWVTSQTNFIRIEAAPGHRAVKTGWDDTIFRHSVTDPGFQGAFRIRIGFVEVIGLQIENIFVSDNHDRVFDISDVPAGQTILADGVRVRAVGGSHDALAMRNTNNASAVVTVQNSILEATDEVVNQDGAILNLYQTILRGNNSDNGISMAGSATLVATNCAVFNNTIDFNVGGSPATITNCASDDGDGTNPISPDGGDWNREFINSGTSGDFTLINGRNLHLGGVPIAGGPLTDIDGDPWNATTPSVGVDEYV